MLEAQYDVNNQYLPVAIIRPVAKPVYISWIHSSLSIDPFSIAFILHRVVENLELVQGGTRQGTP